MDNAECCNLPAEYVCKCKPGFEGDGQVECRGESMKRSNNTNRVLPPSFIPPHDPIVGSNGDSQSEKAGKLEVIGMQEMWTIVT